jgi:biotin carboxyl carrier protein
MDFYYQIRDETYTVSVEPDGDGYRVTVGGRSYHVAGARLVAGRLTFQMENQALLAYVARNGSSRHVAVAGESWRLERVTQPQSRPGSLGAGPASGSDVLEATMPGLVVEVYVTEGDKIERGQTLLLLEAMKMELRITAPHAGLVRRVNCAAGQVVERGQVLVEIEAPWVEPNINEHR